MPWWPIFWPIFWTVCFAGASSTNVSVLPSDGRLQYSGEWTNEEAYQFTAQIGASVSLSFQGSCLPTLKLLTRCARVELAVVMDEEIKICDFLLPLDISRYAFSTFPCL